MASMEVILVWVLCFTGLAAAGELRNAANGDGPRLKKCRFPALYNFGDSNSDTGARSAALDFVLPPNGETFFKSACGRQCDGRLLIDFIAEKLGLPYLSAYLDSIGANFRHGANFATGGSSILPGGYSPFHLELQIGQFLQFKSRTSALYEKFSQEGNNSPLKSNLPRPQDFSNALYTFDIGQNDLAHGFEYSSEAETLASIPTILDKFTDAVYTLYNAGARYFWIHNTGPIGCLPNSVIYYRLKPRNLDKYGCVDPQNKVAREFNRQLKKRVGIFRTKLEGAAFTYVDMYSAKYSLISKAKSLGFEDPSKLCCGGYYGYHYVPCGKTAVVNGTVYGGAPCRNPSKQISWDGIHYSEAANSWIAKTVLDGALSNPKVSVRQACRASP